MAPDGAEIQRQVFKSTSHTLTHEHTHTPTHPHTHTTTLTQTHTHKHTHANTRVFPEVYDTSRFPQIAFPYIFFMLAVRSVHSKTL